MYETLGWRIGCQAYSFRMFTLFEAIEKNAALGLKVMEAYPTQRLSVAMRDTKFDQHSPHEIREAVKAKLKSCGVTLTNYGVVNLPADERPWRILFEFAKDMGIETIVAEPPQEAMDLVEDLCFEFEINVAIHNHPVPSHYWSPDTVLKACAGRGPRIGACADTGHWVRSGVDALEALRRLEGRIIGLHIKDVDRNAPDAEDVPWGTGVGDVRALLKEVHRQEISPVFSIEYVNDAPDPQDDIAQCVAYFERVCGELV